MCYGCSPKCTGCAAKRKLIVVCENCGKAFFRQSGELAAACPRCGVVFFADRKMFPCSYSGWLCSTPCGRLNQQNPDGVFKPCNANQDRIPWGNGGREQRVALECATDMKG